MHKHNSQDDTLVNLTQLSNDRQPERSRNSSQSVASKFSEEITFELATSKSGAGLKRIPSPAVLLDQQHTQPRIKATVCIIQNFVENPSNYLPSIPPIPESCKSEPVPRSNAEIEIEMGQDIGSCCAKYILCLFNFIFFVSIFIVSCFQFDECFSFA